MQVEFDKFYISKGETNSLMLNCKARNMMFSKKINEN